MNFTHGESLARTVMLSSLISAFFSFLTELRTVTLRVNFHAHELPLCLALLQAGLGLLAEDGERVKYEDDGVAHDAASRGCGGDWQNWSSIKISTRTPQEVSMRFSRNCPRQ